MKVLLQLNKTITQYKQDPHPGSKMFISNMVNYSLRELLTEVDTYVDSQVVQQELEINAEPGKPEKK